jgi:hypothetical protein
VAAKTAGESPPSRVQECEGEWMVPVVRGYRSKNDAEASAYLLADNCTSSDKVGHRA